MANMKMDMAAYPHQAPEKREKESTQKPSTCMRGSKNCISTFKFIFGGKVSTISCMETLINESAVSNVFQVVAYNDGRVIVPIRDWQTFLSPHGKALKGIKALHHLRFTSAELGIFFYRQRPGDTEESFRILSTAISTSSPLPLSSPGLDLKRQKYLYQKILPFVPEKHQDTLLLHSRL
ncbi:hypothetical protein CAPTEDRAFT_212567 [Capitella teleta]|uniref:Uncharacterized protein n=1 Tax=Capitella teleta TaxID=283909 RepID=R7UTV4_CAPTE|nr:hypothetical protein CAPTEDRAFT_212567 [Capitella teleta]|eukprot:ELU09553.1 hypothetical protein CAPTEDRAFT_212567 [Capitella teleta]